MLENTVHVEFVVITLCTEMKRGHKKNVWSFESCNHHDCWETAF